MKPDAFEWMFRVAMMALAGLVSLSMLGAIDTMARGGGGPGGFMIDTAPSGRASRPAEQAPRPAPAEDSPEVKIADAAQPGAGLAVASPADAEIAKWLEVIAYVLFALTGLVALVALILWRAVSELRRR